MKNKDELAQLMKNPYSMDSGSLRSFVSEHPYFEIGHYLVAFQMKDKDKLASEEATKKAALHASDRRKLYQWLNSTLEEITVNESIADTDNLETQTNKDDGSSVSIDHALNDHVVEEKDEIEELIIHHSTEHLLESELELRSDITKEVEKPVTEMIPEKEDVIEEDDSSFIGWLHKMKPMDGSEVEDYLSDDDEKAKPDSEVKIERTIKDNEPEPDLQEISKQASDSVTDSGNFITETLANIYIKQKKYPKAIKTLEELSLKYPEKSGYFASRIEEIKKLS